ncbi:MULTISPECIES: acetate--CoA ligase [unclassified Rathayibacter]|uniref:acetate--CoA ligase n=1 Tax=unclassified Rathayibacter TaxID=2609250 RepID=UPI000CE8E950|nr:MULTISPECIES: acetate--CoA ligase [unclassified Rathayibacter]PPI19976.1 acetate--CoA ligase [Rathayibacter sp. AY1B6]PPI26493.1 acetate--CoA ligase [Rathayibacter sp. AY1B5]PPI29872.1 acetate--CoA ligase [Rathayibacter sp. AY1B1]
MSGTIANLLDEHRRFPPPADFAAQANAGAEEYSRAAADPVAFWEEAARRLEWAEPWHTAHSWEPAAPLPDGSLSVPRTTWFEGGRLNVAVNCVDRHVDAGRGGKTALHFEGERGDRRSITYAELQREVSRAANALTALGIGKGDRVVVYLPVIPETIVITLAIARIGAIHSLVFGGFSAEAVRFRVEDTGAKLLVTTDGQFRRGAAVPVKAGADRAVEGVASIEHVLVVRRTGETDVPWTPGRDVWWHELVDAQSDVHEAEAFDSETPLFIIYTSGTTGKPKGLVHTSGGYLTQASWTHWAVFDAKPDDVHWCTADLAWVTAHTYEIYGPLSNGLTQVIYEGTPSTPHTARHFEIIERYGVTVYYTAPTLIRTLMTWFPDGVPAQYDLSSLRLLGTVGESINPEAWVWFHEAIGGGRCPIVDTWWQSETGAAVMCPLPGVSTLKPGSSLGALPGLGVLVVDEHGERVPNGSGGYLVVDRTGPALARTVWGDPERYRDSYWARYASQGWFFSGDGAKYDADGDVWVLGRVDDVINVSGHRLSTIEIESALVAHPAVGEAGVVGVADATTGQAIAAFVIPSDEAVDRAEEDPAYWTALGTTLSAVLRDHVAVAIGPIAKPRDVVVVPDLPKTRSGKIMRRLLGDIRDGRPLGDVTSLQDDTVPARIARIVAERG